MTRDIALRCACGGVTGILARIHARHGKPPLPPDSHPRGPLWLVLRFGWQLLRNAFAGVHKPSPVFDARGRPIVEPTVVSPEERERLRGLCGERG